MQTQEPIENIIAIHPHLLQKFMKQGKEFQNLLALYTFYLYHAQKQKTNSILATNEFVHNGLGWGLDKIKRVKKLLKKLEVIKIMQKGYYSYIKMLYIYTQKKIEKVLNPKDEKIEKTVEVKKSDEVIEAEVKKEVKPTKTKENFLDLFQRKHYLSNPLEKWLNYCKKNKIFYTNTHLKNWAKKIDTSFSIEYEEAISKAIEKKWKDFYVQSECYQYLGKHLMQDKLSKNLIDIRNAEDKGFYYKFEEFSFTSKGTPQELFSRFEYREEKSHAMPLKLKEMLAGAFNRI